MHHSTPYSFISKLTVKLLAFIHVYDEKKRESNRTKLIHIVRMVLDLAMSFLLFHAMNSLFCCLAGEVVASKKAPSYGSKRLVEDTKKNKLYLMRCCLLIYSFVSQKVVVLYTMNMLKQGFSSL